MLGIILGLFLVSPQQVKQQTQIHLMNMQNISAIETIGKHSYEVAMFGGKQTAIRPPTVHGVYVKDAWFVLLHDSQLWKFEAEGDHFTYSDTCGWLENKPEIVPCEGEIYTADDDIVRITQRMTTKKWGVVSLDMTYGWEMLSDRRLLPQFLVLKWRDKQINARWSEYREFRASEPTVREADADEPPAMNLVVHSVRQSPAIEQETVTEVAPLPPIPVNSIDALFPTRPPNATKAVKRNWLKRWFVIRR